MASFCRGQQLSGRRRVGVAALIGGAAAVAALTYCGVVRKMAQLAVAAARWEGAGGERRATELPRSLGIGVNYSGKK